MTLEKLRRRKPLIVAWVLALVCALGIMLRAEIVTDMSAFLPSKPSAEQKIFLEQLSEGVLSRTLLIAVERTDATSISSEQLALLSQGLLNSMRESGNFESVQNGEKTSTTAVQSLLMKYRYLLSPAVNAQHFSASGLKQSIGDSINFLSSGLGGSLKDLLFRDPTGEMLALVDNMSPEQQPNTEHGVWFSSDGSRALLVAQISASGTNTDAQEVAINNLSTRFAALMASTKITGAQLRVAGAPAFAVEGRELVRGQAFKLSLIGMGCVIVLLLLAFRSLPMLLVSMLPVLTGALIGAATVTLLFGNIHGITIGFGVTLMGEAIDYSIYYFIQSRRSRGLWLQQFWPTVRIGVLTSIIGFSALIFSSFTGLSQLGVFSGVGLLCAAWVTRFILPQLGMERAAPPTDSQSGRRLQACIALLAKLRNPILGLSLLALIWVAFGGVLLPQHRTDVWNKTLSTLNPTSRAMQELDLRLRKDMGAPTMQFLAVVQAPTQELALQGAEQISRQFGQLKEQGILNGFESPSKWLPSHLTQLQRQNSLPTEAALRQNLGEALNGLPLELKRLEGFVKDIEVTRQLPLLEKADFNGMPLAASVGAMLTQSADKQFRVFIPLRPSKDNATNLRTITQTVEQAHSIFVKQGGADSSIRFLDIGAIAGNMYAQYFNQALLLAGLGLAAIVILLVVHLKDFSKSAKVLLPLMLSLCWVIFALNVWGESLGLLHLVGLLLVVAVGSNYALFFNSNPNTDAMESEGSTLISVFLANAATVMGFGVLAFSQVPVLHALGITVAPGAFLVLVFSAIFSKPHR